MHSVPIIGFGDRFEMDEASRALFQREKAKHNPRKQELFQKQLDNINQGITLDRGMNISLKTVPETDELTIEYQYRNVAGEVSGKFKKTITNNGRPAPVIHYLKTVLKQIDQEIAIIKGEPRKHFWLL